MSPATIIVAIVVVIAVVYTVRHVRGLFKGTAGCCGGGCFGNCSSCHTEPVPQKPASAPIKKNPEETKK